MSDITYADACDTGACTRDEMCAECERKTREQEEYWRWYFGAQLTQPRLSRDDIRDAYKDEPAKLAAMEMEWEREDR